jgi:hypothetical protein
VPGVIIVKPDSDDPNVTIPEQKINQNMQAVPGRMGDFRMKYVPRVAGKYLYSTLHDPDGEVSFEVVEPRLEVIETGMNIELLQSLASLSGGEFFREENLYQLPEMVSAQSGSLPIFRKVKLYHSVWLLSLLIFFFIMEWLIRRLSQLK